MKHHKPFNRQTACNWAPWNRHAAPQIHTVLPPMVPDPSTPSSAGHSRTVSELLYSSPCSLCSLSFRCLDHFLPGLLYCVLLKPLHIHTRVSRTISLNWIWITYFTSCYICTTVIRFVSQNLNLLPSYVIPVVHPIVAAFSLASPSLHHYWSASTLPLTAIW